MKSFTRSISSQIEGSFADTPIVVLNGARQVGKSTLAKTLRFPGTFEVLTLDERAIRDAAASDPRAFVRRAVDTLVIDEAQLEPGLFRALKAEVDQNRRPGRFLLTGSSRLLEAPEMADALVGRVECLELWPLAQNEIHRTDGLFIDRVFESPTSLMRSGLQTREELIDLVCVGGFPEAVARGHSATRRNRWFQSYVDTSVMKVVKELADIERVAEMPRLLKLCAARTATELNVANIASDLGVPARTLSGYLARLATAFFIQLIPAWSTNISSKVVRKPKLVLVDSGLAAHLVGASAKSFAGFNSGLGPLLETFVITELVKQRTWSTTMPSIYHFRDRGGAEVDIILEYPDGRVVGVEVKATSTPRSEDFAGLRFLAERIGDRFAYGVLLTAAPEAVPFGPKMAALPVDALWRDVSA
jgi:uncharacterized protein